MAGLLNRLAPKGYPGQIFVCMLRYGYGNQQHIEKMEILHNWYSHLRAFLPVKYQKKSDEYIMSITAEDGSSLMDKAHQEITTLFQVYDPAFEKPDMTTDEKNFILSLWAVYEILDEITAKSKIIDDIKSDGEVMEV